MATTNLITKTIGNISIQQGNGTPDHISELGSIYIDIDTGLHHENNNGMTGWNTNESFSSANKVKLNAIAASAEVNVQSDWNSVSGNSLILNKPTDITDLSGHNVTELLDISSVGSGSIITTSERNKVGFMSVTQAVDLDTIESDTSINNAKVTNATHTGEVTGSTSLSINKTAISGKASVAAAATDEILIGDVDDNGNLKKVTAQSIANLGGFIPSDMAAAQISKSISMLMTSTPTDVVFDTADVENLPAEVSWDIGSPERISVLETALYKISASVSANNISNTNETLRLELFLNGVATGEIIDTIITKNASVSINPTRLVELSTNDYVSFKANQIGASSDITISANTKFELIKMTGEKGDTGSTGAGSNIIIQYNDITIGTVTDVLNITGNSITSVVDSGANKTTLNINSEWQPKSVPLTGLLLIGAGFIVNTGGAGVYLKIANTEQFFFNDTLDRGSSIYDGSNLKIRLHVRLSATPNVGDLIGLDVKYGFYANDEVTSSGATTIVQQNIVVDAHATDEVFSIDLGLMTGTIGDKIIMWDVTRTITGLSPNSFAGNLEVLAIDIIKV